MHRTASVLSALLLLLVLAPAVATAQEAPAASLATEIAAEDLLAREDLRPLRSRQPIGLSAALGYNGLAGALGPLLTLNAGPRLALDVGAGLGAQGLRLGLQGRLNLLDHSWTPFLAAGLQGNSGYFGGVQRVRGGPNQPPVDLRSGPSLFAVPAVGMAYQGEDGLMFSLGVGYAYRVAGAPGRVRHTDGSALRGRLDPDRLMGDGPAVALSLGHAL